MDDLKDLLKSLRTDYNMDNLDIGSADKDPFRQFAGWMQLAIDKNVMEPNAMTLSTVSDQKKPSSRIVLLRNFDHDGFVFYTNYESHKSRELSQNKHAALNFFWPELHKQVRIEGKAQKIDQTESDAYFNSRPRESQLGAWVSVQSTHLESREELDEKFENLTKEFEGKTIKRPEHWGGYRV